MNATFNEIYEIEKLEELFAESHKKPIVFFKHSITCPISRNVFSEIGVVDSEIWVTVVQDARKVSDALEEKTGIKHESPQTIIIHKGTPIYYSSHYDTRAEDISNALLTETAAI